MSPRAAFVFPLSERFGSELAAFANNGSVAVATASASTSTGASAIASASASARAGC